tara:strand:- start:16872 stop:18179 length:1308 start_codon:yes stop_codon:yes gene_type:complete
MLIKGNIPHSEPVISAGIILPEDNQKKISFKLSDPKAFSIQTDALKNVSCEHEYIIKVKNGNIFFNVTHSSKIRFIPKNYNQDEYILVDSVPAGRGFHWSKNISVKLQGELIVKTVDNSLFIINKLPIENYIMCVATSEMSPECPSALLESQTIAARSWLLAADEQKHKDLKIDVCNDDCCQRYQGINNLTESAKIASHSTRGMVIIHYHSICDARYSKSCGGITENNENVWSELPKPYLRSVQDSIGIPMPTLKNAIGQKSWFLSSPSCFCGPNFVPEDKLPIYLGSVDSNKLYFRWNLSISQNELLGFVNEKTGNSYDHIHSLIPLKRGMSGRITQLKIEYIKDDNLGANILESEYEIRRVLHKDFLFSSAFVIQVEFQGGPHPERFNLIGAGWGHGVGLCQIGALGMALAGKNSTQILNHYYSSIEIRKLYD